MPKQEKCEAILEELPIIVSAITGEATASQKKSQEKPDWVSEGLSFVFGGAAMVSFAGCLIGGAFLGPTVADIIVNGDVLNVETIIKTMADFDYENMNIGHVASIVGGIMAGLALTCGVTAMAYNLMDKNDLLRPGGFTYGAIAGVFALLSLPDLDIKPRAELKKSADTNFEIVQMDNAKDQKPSAPKFVVK